MLNRYSPDSFLNIIKMLAHTGDEKLTDENILKEKYQDIEMRTRDFLFANADIVRHLVNSSWNSPCLKIADLVSCFVADDISLEIAMAFRDCITDTDQLLSVVKQLDADDVDAFILQQHEYWKELEMQQQNECSTEIDEHDDSFENAVEEESVVKRSTEQMIDNRPQKKSKPSILSMFAEPEKRKHVTFADQQPTHTMRLRCHK